MSTAAKPSGYDQDSEDLGRWLLKQHARKLLMKPVYRQKKVREHYIEMRGLLAPSPDIEQAEVFKVPHERYRYVPVMLKGEDGPASAIKRAAKFRVINCCRDKIGKDVMPEVWYSRRSERASFHKVQLCGSVWTCPTCSRKINIKRQSHIRAAYELVINNAPQVHTEDLFDPVHNADALLITFTIKHGRGDHLAPLLAALKEADRAMQQLHPYRRLVKRDLTGYIGRIASTEITYGDNGWHPHSHQLWFFDRRLTGEEMEIFRSVLFKCWTTACVGKGLPAPLEYGPDGRCLGVDVRRALTAEEYMTKTGVIQEKWTVEREMASSHAKKGKKAGKSPFQLLYDSSQGEERAGDLFRVYADATRGRHQLEFSHSLRKYLEELDYKAHLETDEELAGQLEEDDSSVLGRLTDDDFNTMCNADDKDNAFGKVLYLCKHEGFEAATAWLSKLRKSYQPPNWGYVDPDTGEVLPCAPSEKPVRKAKPTPPPKCERSEKRVTTPKPNPPPKCERSEKPVRSQGHGEGRTHHQYVAAALSPNPTLPLF